MARVATSFRLSDEAKVLLEKLKEHYGISRQGVLEMLIRKDAKAAGVGENTKQGKSKGR